MAAGWSSFDRVRRDSGFLWAATLVFDRVSPLNARRMWRPRVVPAAVLQQQVELILDAWGMSKDHVTLTAEKVLYADLRGIESQGCSKLAFYQELREAGKLDPRPVIEVVLQNESTALIDGGGGLGHVPASRAMELAISKCQASGIGVVAVRNSGHFGAAGAYASLASERDLIGIATTSTPTPAVVPTFGKDPILGTNPISIAVPAARNRPFLLDMATSTVSLGTLVETWRGGRRIPPGWALDDRGRPTTDGRVAARSRRLAPLGGDRESGGHKGYGLALAVEILSELLPDAAGGDEQSVGHFLLALDPARFRERGSLAADLDRLVDSLHDAPAATPDQPVLVPGDPEEECLAERTRSGIPLSRSVFEDLRAVANASAVPFTLEGSTDEAA